MRSLRLSALPVLLCLAAALFAQPQVIPIELDATQAPRLLLRASQKVAVTPGSLRLAYPKWIPGEHGPSGPLGNVVEMRFLGNGKPLRWTRDESDLFVVEVEVPEGVTEIETRLTYGIEPHTDAANTLARVAWNRVVLYPVDRPSTDLVFQPTVKVPEGWTLFTALKPTGGNGQFEPVNLERLIDSPLMMGKYAQQIELTPDGSVSHLLAIVADAPELIVLDGAVIQGHSKLVAETQALFGGPAYGAYTFLLSVSDQVSGVGLEHHESSEDGVGADGLTSEIGLAGLAELNAHEFAHAWNGKFRRPAPLLGANPHSPMRTSLLWMYEGMTQFLGVVLPARAGLWTPEFFRETIAARAAMLDHESGRGWRPLADTAICAQTLYYSGGHWSQARRGVSFYDEMIFNWIEADAIIRRGTNGSKSLDDFCAEFHRRSPADPWVKPYSREDIVASLNKVFAYPWDAWLQRQVYEVLPRAPLGGLQASGWRLVYTAEPNLVELDWETQNGQSHLLYTLGVVMDGPEIKDVVMGGPAETAGLFPGIKLLAVGDKPFSEEALEVAILHSSRTGNVHLLGEASGQVMAFEVACSGGWRFPHLERIEGVPDLLSQLIAPRSQSGVQAGERR